MVRSSTGAAQEAPQLACARSRYLSVTDGEVQKHAPEQRVDRSPGLSFSPRGPEVRADCHQISPQDGPREGIARSAALGVAKRHSCQAE